MIYRIAQDALTNVLQHTRLDPAGPVDPKRTRLGLSGTRERLLLVGGWLGVEAAAGSGTTLFVQVPLCEAAALEHT